MELAKRDDVPVELTWDLSLIYPTEEAMLADAQKMKELSLSMEASYKGNLTDAATINHCLDDYQEVYRLITLTANYCDLAVSVDYYNSANQTRNDRINSLISEIFSRLTFIESELSEQSKDVLNEAMQQSDTNRCYLAEILRNKAHRLSPETERAISALSQTFSAPYQIYNMAKLADMKFDSFTVNGKEYPLGYSLFEDNYEYEKDTDIRRSAFSAFSAKIRQYENVTAAAYNAQLQTEKTMATLRGFDSVIDSLLFPQHETERQFLLVGIGCLLGLRIIEIDGVDVPIEHPQKLHHRLAAADGGGIFGAIGQQVAEIQEPPDILFARLRGDMRAHVKKETGPGSPQGAEGVGKHIVRYAEKPDPEIVAYLLDGN